MRSAIVAFVIALLISAALTPVVRRIAIARGAIDEAGGRHVHAGRIPRLGGLAVAVAFFVPLFVLFVFDSSLGHLFFRDPRRILGLGAGAAIVLILGAVDDARGVTPRQKLLVEASAALVAYWAGYRIDAVSLPLIGIVNFGLFSIPITIAWFIGVINALNLIDGLDGLAAGIAFFACICNIVVGSVNDSLFVVLLSAALCGGLLGFLIYNFNPASIFMGDSGSLFLGFILAASSMLGSTVKSSTTVAILVPALALGVPISDTVWAFARRFWQRRPIFDGDRGHIHHRLLDLGFSQRKAVMLLYGLSLGLAAVAMGLALGRSLAVGGALIAMTAMLVGVVRTAGSFTRSRTVPIRQKPRLPLVELLRVEVPRALILLQGPTEIGSVRGVLDEFVDGSRLPGYRLQLPKILGQSEEREDGRGHSESSASDRSLNYLLDAGGHAAQISFVLRDSHKDAQVHVLLQLVADAVERALLPLAARAQARIVIPTTSAASSTDFSELHSPGGRPSPV